MEGVISIPSARLYANREILIGTTFVPPGYFKRTSGYLKGEITPNAGLNSFVSLNFFPFLDVMFRYSTELNVPISPKTKYFPDRMFAIKLRLIKESKMIPEIAVGLHDFSKSLGISSGENPIFTSQYVVLTKKIILSRFSVDLTLGKGFDSFLMESNEFKGLFGGVLFNLNNQKNLQFGTDLNDNLVTSGIKFTPLPNLTITGNYHFKYSKFGWILVLRKEL